MNFDEKEGIRISRQVGAKKVGAARDNQMVWRSCSAIGRTVKDWKGGRAFRRLFGILFYLA